MKSVLISALVVAGALAATPALANKDLATKSGCMACLPCIKAGQTERMRVSVQGRRQMRWSPRQSSC